MHEDRWDFRDHGDGTQGVLCQKGTENLQGTSFIVKINDLKEKDKVIIKPFRVDPKDWGIIRDRPVKGRDCVYPDRNKQPKDIEERKVIG